MILIQILAEAYGYFQTNGHPQTLRIVPFRLNVGGSSTDNTVVFNAIQAQLAIGQSSCVNDGTLTQGPCSESDDFQIVYVQLAYQPTTQVDHDPDSEGARSGDTRVFVGQAADNIPADCSGMPVGGTGSLIYQEAARDHDVSLGTGTVVRSRTTPHEVGHQFGLKGDQPTGFAVMSFSPAEPIQFIPEHLHILRCRVKSPGEQACKRLPFDYLLQASTLEWSGVFDHFAREIGPGATDITPVMAAIRVLLQVIPDEGWRVGTYEGKRLWLIPNEVGGLTLMFPEDY